MSSHHHSQSLSVISKPMVLGGGVLGTSIPTLKSNAVNGV